MVHQARVEVGLNTSNDKLNFYLNMHCVILAVFYFWCVRADLALSKSCMPRPEALKAAVLSTWED